LNTTTTITNSNGSIMRVTIMGGHPETFSWAWLIVGVAAAALIAWRVRRLFWRKDSN
jgi:hypothetical protein